MRNWLSETGISIPILFKKFDEDGDGRIDSSELKTGLLSLNLADLPPSQVERLIKTIDEDGDGQIDLAELHETITGEKYFPDKTSNVSVDSDDDDSTDEEEESDSDEDESDDDEDESDDDESDDDDDDEDDDDTRRQAR